MAPSRQQARRRRTVAIAALAVGIAVIAALAASSGGNPSKPPAGTTGGRLVAVHRTATQRAAAATASRVMVSPLAAPPSQWTVVARVGTTPVAWEQSSGGATLLRFDQRHLHLTLHAGSSDGGVTGWVYGDQISAREIHHIVAAFNGGFKLTYSNVGFESAGHVAVPLKRGLASIVTYANGTTGIGAWDNGVPSGRSPVYSVLQNQFLLVDRGVPAANVATCVIACWGGTIKDLTVVARSGLGITAGGQLVWAAGEQLSPAALASALVAGGAIRAIELDINPDWVAGYLYVHHATGPVANPVVPGQRGITGQLLAPYSRDFLAIVAN